VTTRIFAPAFFALLLAAAPVSADVTLANAWMRPAAAGENAQAYVDIRSDASLKLVAVTTPMAREVEIVVVQAKADGFESNAVSTFDVPAGTQTRFAYRGNVLRLVGVMEPLANGTPVPLTLEFRDADGRTVKATTNVQVRGLVARRAPSPAPDRPASSAASPEPAAPHPAAPAPAPKM